MSSPYHPVFFIFEILSFTYVNVVHAGRDEKKVARVAGNQVHNSKSSPRLFSKLLLMSVQGKSLECGIPVSLRGNGRTALQVVRRRSFALSRVKAPIRRLKVSRLLESTRDPFHTRGRTSMIRALRRPSIAKSACRTKCIVGVGEASGGHGRHVPVHSQLLLIENAWSRTHTATLRAG